MRGLADIGLHRSDTGESVVRERVRVVRIIGDVQGKSESFGLRCRPGVGQAIAGRAQGEGQVSMAIEAITTKTQMRNAPVGYIWQPDMPGLVLRVRGSGRRTWVLDYRVNGRAPRIG